MTSFQYSLFFHLLFVCIWVGGLLFISLVLIPAIRNHPEKPDLIKSVGLRFRQIAWIALLGITITGIINLTTKGVPINFDYFLSCSYGKTALLKITLYIFLILLNLFHDIYIGDKFNKSSSGNIIVIAKWSGRFTVILSIVIMLLGIILALGGL